MRKRARRINNSSSIESLADPAFVKLFLKCAGALWTRRCRHWLFNCTLRSGSKVIRIGVADRPRNGKSSNGSGGLWRIWPFNTTITSFDDDDDDDNEFNDSVSCVISKKYNCIKNEKYFKFSLLIYWNIYYKFIPFKLNYINKKKKFVINVFLNLIFRKNITFLISIFENIIMCNKMKIPRRK